MCRSLKGEKEAIVEFDYDVITPSPVHKFSVIAVDMVSDRVSNVDAYSFILAEEISSHHIATLELISIPRMGSWFGHWRWGLRLQVCIRTKVARHIGMAKMM